MISATRVTRAEIHVHPLTDKKTFRNNDINDGKKIPVGLNILVAESVNAVNFTSQVEFGLLITRLFKNNLFPQEME